MLTQGTRSKLHHSTPPHGMVTFFNRRKVLDANFESICSMHFLISIDEVNITKLLIAAKANVNARDADDFGPLHWAAMDGDVLY